MSGEVAASCCCGGGGGSTEGVYYAEACSFDGCIRLSCNQETEIAFCFSYLQALGLSLPLDLSRCYYFRRGCCIYRLTSSDPTAQCPGTLAMPVNEGTYVGVRNPNGGLGCCSSVFDVEPYVPATCITAIWDTIDPDWKTHMGFGSNCWALIADDYQGVDQWGVVKTKAPKIQTTFTYCVNNYGIQENERCDDCKPLYPVRTTHTVMQSVGTCDPNDEITWCPTSHKNITKFVANTLNCNDCNPCKCCGNDPCEGVDPDYPWCDDHNNTYTVRTAYGLRIPTLGNLSWKDWYTQPVMKVTIEIPEGCEGLPSATVGILGGIYGEAPGAIQLLNDPWDGQLVGLKIADISVIAYSCSVNSLAGTINNIFNGLVTAEVLPGSDGFWLGNRQTCTCCDGSSPPSSTCWPEDPWSYPKHPPKFPTENGGGDWLYVSSFDVVDGKGVYTIGAASVQMWVHAEQHLFCSPPAILCDWFLIPDNPIFEGKIKVGAVSATGDTLADYQVLSPAEYNKGLRYTMRQIEESSYATTICTSLDPAFPVLANNPVAGFPLDMLTNACGHLASRLNYYPFVFTLASCDPESPIPVNCPLDGATAFQSPGSFCQTFATIPQVVSPSS